ncbi:GRB2-associated-binding protein 1-like [Myripristis murdjan]|uniref:GRB2-associated-binding protein 1-like n=1 Tax=Myripristis murdjan TaxID=586833 RepID=A0A667WDG5_9TELE|nr:GRB2-associated-binding protein 1-like [Myripristis murdjan]
MSAGGGGEVVCEGWLRKSPPEKKLRRYAWKRRWFVLRSGRMSGEPDVLQYYKHQQARRPIRTINLDLCEQVDAGLSFTKKELECSFVFDLRTEERVWYLVAESEDDMNRWVSSICLLCGFNPTEQVPDKFPVAAASSSVTRHNPTAAATMTGSVPAPYDPVSVRHLEPNSTTEEDYLWLSHCQSHTRPLLGSSSSLETDYNDNISCFPVSMSSSSSSSSPSSFANGLHPPPSSSSSSSSSSGFKNAAWNATAVTSPLSQSLDASVTSDLQRRGAGRPRCHPSPHPRKHSLDFQLRPVAMPLAGDAPVPAQAQAYTNSGYQIPRSASSPKPRPPCHPSSTPSVETLTPAELHASTPTPPPRPPKPPAVTAQGESSTLGTGSATLPWSSAEPERRDGGMEGGGGGGGGAGGRGAGMAVPRSNTVTVPGRMYPGAECVHVPKSLSDRASMFEFSDSFNSYFFNKGMVPLGSVCSEDDDVDENYVPMSAATTEPPLATRVPPPPPSVTSDPATQLQDPNYVAMTPLPPLPAPTFTSAELASLGRQVPPPAHLGFRNSPLDSRRSRDSAPPQEPRDAAGGGEVQAQPPPIHRNLKPQHKGVCADRTDCQTTGEPPQKPRVKPAPLDITPAQDWQEVPPPIRSPVTRTFTRDPSSRPSVRRSSAHSSSPSSDSDDPDENYVPMTTSGLSCSAGEQSLRLLLHRASEGGASCSPLLRRSRGGKQVEYLDLDLHTGRATTAKRTAQGRTSDGGGEERARGERARVDYVVVDPERTKALRNTREAWHDGRMSTEKEKC